MLQVNKVLFFRERVGTGGSSSSTIDRGWVRGRPDRVHHKEPRCLCALKRLLEKKAGRREVVFADSYAGENSATTRNKLPT